MGVRPLNELGQQMVAALPPALRDSNDYLAVIHALSRELTRLEDSIESLRPEFSPATAVLLLPAWEFMVKLPVGGAGASVEQRQLKVVGRLRKLLTDEAGLGQAWVQDVTDLIGPGWTYEEHITGDGTSPAAYTLRITLPFPPAGSAYAEALTQIREVTPAHLDIVFESAAGFVLDESELDLEVFGS